MSKVRKRLIAFFLVLAMVITSGISVPTEVFAKSNLEKIQTNKGKKSTGKSVDSTAISTGGKLDISGDKVIGSFEDRAQAGETYAIDFTNTCDRYATFLFKVSTVCNMEVLVVDSKATEYEVQYTVDDWQLDAQGDASISTWIDLLPKGDGTIYVTFDADVSYKVTASIAGVDAYMAKSYSVTRGFTRSLYIYGGYGEKVTSWSSSKKSIATVSKKGVVTGKKNGKCTITAKLSNGKKLKTTVSVVSNSWSWPVNNVGDVPYGYYSFQLKKAELNSKGNLVCTYRVVNGTTNYYLTKVYVSLTVTHLPKNKTVGTVSGNKTLNLGHRKKKDITYTIPKKKLKIKKFDLRNETINFNTYRDIYYTYK